MATTVRVGDRTANTLRDLAKVEQRSIGQVIEDAVARYKQEKFWESVEVSVQDLRADPRAWKSYKEEVAALEGGSLDGLANDSD